MIKTNLSKLKEMKADGEKFSVLTAYDATFARLMENAGVEVLLVGDSLGMVIQGQESTVPVTVDDIIYHTQAVRRGAAQSFIMADMPFMSCNSAEQALQNAGRIMQQGGAHMVKIEGGSAFVETIAKLSTHGVPVCAHLGLMPQSYYKIGGYKIQGRDEQSAQAILHDAKAMQDAGADCMLLECVPADLAEKVTLSLSIPVIGIGAGPHCDAQVLVMHDMLGMNNHRKVRFVQDFLSDAENIQSAIESYVQAVKSGKFPSMEQSF